MVTVNCVGAAEDDPESVGASFTSFEDFKASVYQEPGTGVYIVDGDTPIETEEGLREFYEQKIQGGALIVNQVNGVDDRWNDAQKLNISYCVSTAFAGNYSAVVGAMARASNAWRRAANIKLVHLNDQDPSCDAANTNVVFDVRPTSGQPYLARAFFPSYSRANRNILIDSSSFGPIAPYTLTGILRHEIGHVLGFRHEHTRPEAAVCFENNSWRQLTPYDSFSAMHYPQCNGSNTSDLVLTPLDRRGAKSLYGVSGKDDLFLYRPGQGAAWVARSGGDGSFFAVYAVGDNGPAAPNGIAGYDLLAATDRALRFDHDGDAKDDLFLYRPGQGAAWVARSNGDGSFVATYAVGDNGSAAPNGIAGYDLLSTADRVIDFDYNGDSIDDLFLYRPGQGAAWVARSNGDGSFTPVYAVGDNGSAAPNGIAGYDLLSPGDRVLAFDYNGDGRGDLFLYRPGQGAAWVARSNGDGSFTAVYAVGDNGPAAPNGIAGYDLLSTSDRVLVMDYNGDGRDDLFLYRPGRGAAWVARSNGDGSFTSVYAVGDNGSAAPNGIAGYDLLSLSDRVLVLDYNGDGMDDLFLYRPGQGAAWVARSNGDGSFTAVYAVGDNGSASPNGIAGYDLLSPGDQVLRFDYNADAKDDLFLYRPGQGAAWVARSNGDGSFTAVYAVGDNGSAAPNGIAGYDLLSPSDRVLSFDDDGQ